MIHMLRSRVSGGGPSSTAVRSIRFSFIVLSVAGLTAGVVAGLAGAPEVADGAWAATASVGLIAVAVAVLRGLLRREAGIDIIALVAIAGAVALNEYLAGAVISVMVASGRALEDYANGRAGRELRALLERAPRVVHRYEDGALTAPLLEEVRPSDLLLVKPGEVVPIDGAVVGNRALLDEAALTGEAGAVERQAGEQVWSGTVNVGPSFDMRATTTAETSTYAGIVRLVRQAQESKAPFVRLADRYGLAFVPFTLLLAGGAWLVSGDPVRALAVVVVATPCPLILAVPVAVVSGISHAARRGIIVKGGGAFEALAKARVLLLDKTGTVTAGRPVLSDIETTGAMDAREMLRLAASIEQMSPHLIAAAVVQKAHEQNLVLALPSSVVEETGFGIRGAVDGHQVAVGRLDWVSSDHSADWVSRLQRRTILSPSTNAFVAVDGVVLGALILEDSIRPDTPRTLRALRRAGIQRIVMVTGDRAEVAESVGAALGVDLVLSERTPAEKVEAARTERGNGTTIMVGDGINDAPALAAADIGVAMGARGATASSEAADVVIVVDQLDRLAEALSISRRARRIAVQSVVAGMALSGVGMVVAAAGYLAPVSGAMTQEAIDVAVILNALRALGGYQKKRAVPAQTSELTRRFRMEHLELLPMVNRIRTVADSLGDLDPMEAFADLRGVQQFLVESLLPHEEAEDKAYYPRIAQLLGGDDPTGTMSRGHVEIAHLTRVFGRLLDEVDPAGLTARDIADIRSVLYGLHAILRLHFAQEEEAYLSLPEAQPPHEGSHKMSKGK
jgi:heavy metal translocating P-type ATPase